jgi:hypothetical protein
VTTAPLIFPEAAQHGVSVFGAHDDAEYVGDGAAAANGEAGHSRRVVDAQLAADRRQVLLCQVDRACSGPKASTIGIYYSVRLKAHSVLGLASRADAIQPEAARQSSWHTYPEAAAVFCSAN